MSDYTKATNFASKDSLSSGNPLKIVKGTEIDTELTAIAAAITSKANITSPTLLGTPLAPTATTGSNTTQIATTAFVQTSALGYGQTWQDFTGVKVQNTNYTNSTGRPIMVAATVTFNTGTYMYWQVGGVYVIGTGTHAGTEVDSITTIVPAGATYQLVLSGGTWGGGNVTWVELR